jgi:hypothetical protein
MAKKDKLNEDKAQIEKLDRMFEKAKEVRSKEDWQWFQYDLFVAGEHYSKWDKTTQQIVPVTKKDGKPKIVINKTYTTLRAVRNYVLRNRPKAETTPDDLTQENINQVIKLNRFLDYIHDKLKLSRKIKESEWHALKYSVGFWQVVWDEDEKEIAINVVDPYDLYIDPTARSMSEARYMILAVRKPLELLQEDPKYDKEATKDIKSDNLLSSSSLRSRIMQNTKGNLSNGTDTGTVIVKEYWTKEKQKDGGYKVKLTTVAGGKKIREEETDLEIIPFFKLDADVEPLSIYGQGWVKNMISPNKLLDRLESQVAEYNEIMNKGKWVADKGAGVRIINNEHGQIIEKKRAYNVTQANISPMSEAIFKQIQNANMYIEDIGGAHDATLGRIPTGADSGDAIEALQAGDANNLSELTENLELFLEEVYEYILYLASQKYQFARNIIPIAPNGSREFISLIGESASNKPDGATVIPSKNAVDVKMSSWLAHTAEARRRVLKELYQLQVIDAQTVLEGYSIGNVADIIDKVKKQKEEEMQDEMNMKEQEAGIEVAKQQAGQPQQAGTQQAIANIRQLLNGEPVTIPSNIGSEYIGYIDQFLSSEEAQQLPPEITQKIKSLRDQLASSAA